MAKLSISHKASHIFLSLPTWRTRCNLNINGKLKAWVNEIDVAVSNAWANFTFGSEKSRHATSTPNRNLQILSNAKCMKRSWRSIETFALQIFASKGISWSFSSTWIIACMKFWNDFEVNSQLAMPHCNFQCFPLTLKIPSPRISPKMCLWNGLFGNYQNWPSRCTPHS